MEKFLYALRNWKALLRSYLLIGGAHLGCYFGCVAFIGRLYIRVNRDGKWIDLGMVSARKVTQVGVVYLVDAWVTGTNPLTNLKYHDSGTGTTAEANTETALVTQSTVQTGGDRFAGTQSAITGGAVLNVMQSQATVTYTGTAAITEHGLFGSVRGGAAGVNKLWDRSVFSAINVDASTSIQFTYQLTAAYEP